MSRDPVFRKALDKFCSGVRDPATLAILHEQSIEGSKT
jgi:hypothetical protein